jgi:YgiT-type zinc finger domain-containing protein
LAAGFQKEKTMKCVICKNGKTAPGVTTVPLINDSATVVIKNVPADVCDNCGEGYTTSAVTERLQKIFEDAIKAGVEVEIRSYSPPNTMTINP